MARLLSKKPGADIAAYVPTLAQLGSVMGATSRWIAELRARGAIPANGATLAECIQAWGAYLSASATTAGADADLEAARTRLTLAQAEAVERKNAADRRELVSLPDVSAAVVEIFAVVVTRLERLPVEVAGTNHALRVKIEMAVRDAMEDISATQVVGRVVGGVAAQDDDDDDG